MSLTISGVAGEDRAEDPDAGLDTVGSGASRAWPDVQAASPSRRRRRTNPCPPVGRRLGLGHGDPGDRVGLERRPDLVGQVVDQVELAVPVERLAGERALVRLAGAGVRQHGRDRRRSVAGRRPSRPGLPSTRIGCRSSGASAAASPACRSRMTSPSRSVIVTRASVPARRTDSIGATWRWRTTRRRSSAASISRPRRRSPSTSRARRSSSSGIERLGHVQVGAGGQALLAVVGLALGRQQHDVRAGQAQLLLDPATDLEAVEPGHRHVEEDELRMVVLDDARRLLAVRRRQQVDAVVLELLERLLDEQPDVLLVVDDEDGGHRRSLSAARSRGSQAELAVHPRCRKRAPDANGADWLSTVGQRCGTMAPMPPPRSARCARSACCPWPTRSTTPRPSCCRSIFLAIIDEFGVGVRDDRLPGRDRRVRLGHGPAELRRADPGRVAAAAAGRRRDPVRWRVRGSRRSRRASRPSRSRTSCRASAARRSTRSATACWPSSSRPSGAGSRSAPTSPAATSAPSSSRVIGVAAHRRGRLARRLDRRSGCRPSLVAIAILLFVRERGTDRAAAKAERHRPRGVRADPRATATCAGCT